MAKQTISIGTAANDGTGDTLREGASKINQNFDELYIVTGSGQSETITTTGSSNPNIVYSVLINTSQIDVSLAAGTQVGQRKMFLQRGAGTTRVTPSSLINGIRVDITTRGVLDLVWDGSTWFVINNANTHFSIV